ncbi:hypothetical protein WUBG_07152, partial [Wuchereria bancrofti]
MIGLWKDNGYQHTYHSCQLRKEKVKRGKRKAVAEQQDRNRRRQDSAYDNSGSMGGAVISPAIVAATRYAVM